MFFHYAPSAFSHDAGTSDGNLSKLPLITDGTTTCINPGVDATRHFVHFWPTPARRFPRVSRRSRVSLNITSAISVLLSPAPGRRAVAGRWDEMIISASTLRCEADSAELQIRFAGCRNRIALCVHVFAHLSVFHFQGR